jgi:hypothetical protein
MSWAWETPQRPGLPTQERGLPSLDAVKILSSSHDNGDIATWQLLVVGNQVVRQGLGGLDPTGFNLGNPGAGWHVVGVRDMNADGQADILLQNDNGAAAVWDNIQWTLGTSNGTHDGFNINPKSQSERPPRLAHRIAAAVHANCELAASL